VGVEMKRQSKQLHEMNDRELTNHFYKQTMGRIWWLIITAAFAALGIYFILAPLIGGPPAVIIAAILDAIVVWQIAGRFG
jgi:preprotein translocase subunit SecF